MIRLLSKILPAAIGLALTVGVFACSTGDASKVVSPALSNSVSSALSSPTAVTINNDAKIAGDVLCGAYGAYYNGLKIFPQYAPQDPTLQHIEDVAADICSKNLIGSTPLATLQTVGVGVLRLVADQAIKMAAARGS